MEDGDWSEPTGLVIYLYLLIKNLKKYFLSPLNHMGKIPNIAYKMRHIFLYIPDFCYTFFSLIKNKFYIFYRNNFLEKIPHDKIFSNLYQTKEHKNYISEKPLTKIRGLKIDRLGAR